MRGESVIDQHRGHTDHTQAQESLGYRDFYQLHFRPAPGSLRIERFQLVFLFTPPVFLLAVSKISSMRIKVLRRPPRLIIRWITKPRARSRRGLWVILVIRWIVEWVLMSHDV